MPYQSYGGKPFRDARSDRESTYSYNETHHSMESRRSAPKYRGSTRGRGRQRHYVDTEYRETYERASRPPRQSRAVDTYRNHSNVNQRHVASYRHDSSSVATFDGRRTESGTYCKNYTFKGSCEYLNRCRFSHELRLVAHMPAAHSKGIYSLCSTSVVPNNLEREMLNLPQGVSVVELYTASQDKTIKRWMLYPGSSEVVGVSDPNSVFPTNPYTNPLKLRLVSIIELEAVCLCISFSQGCLVCGFNDGTVRIFERESGHEITLRGHSAEVHCAKLIDHVLVSGDWNGLLQLWIPNTNERSFVEHASIEIGSPITCFVDTALSAHFGNSQQLQRHLWVGCSGWIKIVDLQTLTIVHSIPLSSPSSTVISHRRHGHPRTSRHVEPIVMGLVVVEQHVICSVLSGAVQVYSALDFSQVVLDISSDQKSKSQEHRDKRHLCSMTVSSSENGLVIVCGCAQGTLSVLSLPNVTQETILKKAHEHDVRAVHNIGGDPSYFSTAGFDGARSLCLRAEWLLNS